MNIRHKFWVLILATCMSFWVVACSSQVAQRANPTECQTVQHKLGETCVPVHPQRVIAIDSGVLEAALALDVKPIASAEQRAVGSLWKFVGEQQEIFVSLGREGEPNLEKMLQLDPDLIMGIAISHKNYELFNKIAPTVVFENVHDQWKQTLQRVAEVLGERSKSEQVLAQYQARIEDFQSAMGKRLEQTEVSIARFYAAYPPEFRTRVSFPGSVLEDVGLLRPLAQRQIESKKFFEKVSLERLDLLDGDVIFVALDPGAEDSFREFQTSPLWQTLKAVKNDRVYVVDSGYWIFGNILSANLILDDLFEYLIQEKTSNRTEPSSINKASYANT